VGEGLQLPHPGITATVTNGCVILTSNLGASARASLNITSGSLVSKGMFDLTPLPIVGADVDYYLDRNTGEVQLVTPLVEGDRLEAGSVNTRAFLETPAWSTVTVSAAGAHLWFAVDAAATIVAHGLTASTPVNFTTSSPAWGKRERITSAAAAALFSNVRVGDWAIFWDSAVPADILNRAFRVAAVDTAGTWFEIERRTATMPTNPLSFAVGGLTFVRTSKPLQSVVIPTGSNYTSSAVAPLISAALAGAQATVYRTTAMRVNTATFGETSGDIALVAADTDGQQFGLTVDDALANLVGHLASVESASSELGTPDFHQVWGENTGTNTQPVVDWNADAIFTPSNAGQLVALRPIADSKALAGTRYGSAGFSSPLSAITTNGGGANWYNFNLRTTPYEVFTTDRWYVASPYRLSYQDDLTVLVDDDTDSKRFTIPMWRKLGTVGTTYGTTNTFIDADNGGQSLAVGFGAGSAGFDFNDFAVFMPARVKTHDQGDSTHYTPAPADLTQTILWRYYRLGPDGNNARVRYVYPAAASATVALAVDNYTDQRTTIGIQLASGAAKTGFPMNAANKVGVVVVSSASGASSVAFLLGLKVTRADWDGAANTTVYLDIAASGASDHHIPVGATVYLKFNDASFTDGAYTVTAAAAGTITIAGAAAGGAFSHTGMAGTCTYGGSEQTLTGASPVVGVGDYFRWSSTTGLPSDYQATTMYLRTLPNAQTLNAYIEKTESVNTVVAWYTLTDSQGLSVFANAGKTAAQIAASVNALPSPIITGTVIGNGAGLITKSSLDDHAGVGGTYLNLSDGINYVQTTTVPGSVAGNYSLAFKNAVTTSLNTNSDWANETVYVAPRSAKNVVDWLNAPTVSGLFSVADIERSSNAHKVQIASLTPGSGGSVEVQGGTANSLTAAVVGSAQLVGSNYMVATVAEADATGMMAQGWVSIDNNEVLPKSVFTSATVLQAITHSGNNSVVQISGTSFYTRPHASQSAVVVSFERQGNFWAMNDSLLGTALNVGTLAEGDYIRVTVPASYTYHGVGGNEAVDVVSGGNVGVFRVVRVVATPDTGGVTVWFENAAGAEQALAEVQIDTFTADSVMVGDVLSISTSLWDGASSNQGRWTVVDVGNSGSGSFGSASYITVEGLMSTVGAPAAALGSSASQVQMTEGTPARLIKQILSIAPNPLDADLADIKFTTSPLWGKVGATAGSVVTILDKLGFDTNIARGVDGYKHTTGLIAEVTKVIQGDPSDSATYPGVAAAGATVNILGPLVKRIQVTLSIRIRSGAPAEDIKARVKSAVASVINKTPIGQSIALSDLTNAASKVGGVISAVMVSPVAVAGDDLVSVQPYEKPLVLNVDTDVLVSFAGA
jgi:hypothetical protein